MSGGSANGSNEASVSGECRNSNNSGGNSKKGLSYVFSDNASVSGGKWPDGGGAGKGTKGTNVKNVTDDIIKLTKDEKTVVAGHLAKSIEGGEVVEIRSVSSTSVMVNACYDLLSEGISVVPYAFYGVLQ